MIRRGDILSAVKEILLQKSLTAMAVQGPGEDQPLELDSMARLTLLVELENRFQVELMDDEFNPDVLETLGVLCDFVERKIKERPGP
jgi:acyl carrier protein